MEIQRKSNLGCLMMLVAILTGCLSRPNLAPQSFTFSAPDEGAHFPPTGKTKDAQKGAQHSNDVLEIKKITVAAPFAGQSFVYRTGDVSFEQDPYAQFLVSPEESLAEPLRECFRKSAKFSAVTEPGSAQRSTLSAELTVNELYGDFRDRAQPAAVLAIRLVLFDSKSRSVVLEKDYSRRIPLKARTAAAVMAGWNEALEQIAGEAVASFRQGGGKLETK
ncbi:MAG: hypothetical protein C5B50_05935 [Verrucomicrobia bacterium]|nr:MAG: hypothetical protein C5B50_05935 [Verrucomicrobiota bacterium]